MTLGEFRKKTEYISNDTPMDIYVEYNNGENRITVGGECNSVFSNVTRVVLFMEVD